MFSACLIVILSYAVLGVAQAATEAANSNQRWWALFIFFLFLAAFAGCMELLGRINGC